MGEAVTIAEAAERLGVSRQKIWSLVREGVLEAKQNPLDKREKLISAAALRKLERPSQRPPFHSDGAGSNPDVQSVDIEAYLEEHWRPC